MDEKQLQALANELAKNLKTPAMAIPQRPLSPVIAPWNYALRAIVMALLNRNL